MQMGVQTDATCNIQQRWELLANNVASVCTPLPTRAQQLPTLLVQQCWSEFLHPFAGSLKLCNKSQRSGLAHSTKDKRIRLVGTCRKVPLVTLRFFVICCVMNCSPSRFRCYIPRNFLHFAANKVYFLARLYLVWHQ